MAPLLAYNPRTYDNLPNLREAYIIFKAQSAQSVLDNEILALFERYPEARYRFGIQLLHRQFHMGPNEILVEVERTATPWNTKQLSAVDKATLMQGRVVPSCFVLKPGNTRAEPVKAEPYKFRYMLNAAEPIASPSDTSNQAFVLNLFTILQKHGLDDVLGLVALTSELKPQKSGMEQLKWTWEQTFGRVNILFPISKKSKNMIGVVFVFVPGDPATGVSAHCSSLCFCTALGLDGLE
ncbi:hypothetical protein VSDG_09221 [Cytospora chrysosperma]|uniref:Uncharacterized protein n=1 Tax=Cytospora chrysosperma TaxID=252740 RepID=A0A423VC12_CYTCH|nr:hypothetical protein VSDG_09221 [Valsa sordida]